MTRPSARTVGRAAFISLVVGSLLVLVNHGDHLTEEPVCPHFFVKLALSYLIPFIVSLMTAWLVARDRNAG